MAFAPPCLWRALTGYDCPMCGSQRAVQSLLHGDWAAAWSYNPYLWVVLPYLLALAVVCIGGTRTVRWRRRICSWLWVVPWVVLLVAWWIFRNL